jgi:uncharacterized protein with PQ loop repeat
MDTPSILGSIGTIIGLLRAVPQLVRLLRARQAFGVSVDTAATSSIVSFGWAVYGLLTSQIFVSLATGSSGIIFAIVTVIALRFGRKLREFKIAPIWFAVLFLSAVLYGKSGLGIVLSISTLVSNLPQIRVAYRESNLASLSLGTWLLSLSDGLVWGVYALLQHDISILAYGIFQVSTSGIILALKRTRQAKNKSLPRAEDGEAAR